MGELFGAALSDTLFDYIVQGMNDTPPGPAFEDMRDGMLVAANGTGHDCLIWAAFAEYGVGEGASSSTKGGGPFGGGNVKVTESFDLPTECTGTPTNNPPSVALTNTTTALSENTDTSAAVKVADIVINDDALGTNTLSLNGADMDDFEIDTVAMELLLSAGKVLTASTTLNVTVEVDDPSIGVGSDDSDSMAIDITVVNIAPTVALAGQVTALPEDTNTTSATKVADIVVTDVDGVGTNNLSLSGADSGDFEIAGTELRLKAGVALDFETNPVLDVTVAVDDPAVGPVPDDTDALSIAVSDVNEPPTVALTGKVASLAEDATAGGRVKVADIEITDDALGANALTLAGADSADFEIVGSELFLKSGVVLTASTTLNVTVEIDDPSIGAGSDDSDSLLIDITAVGGANAIYVGGIVMAPKGPHLNVTVTVLQSPSGDPVAGATVGPVLLTQDTDSSGTFDVDCDLNNQNGNDGRDDCWDFAILSTNSAGQSKYKLLHVVSGFFQFEVKGLTGPFTWDPSLETGINPATASF
jgi:hypothetical protein